MHRTSFRRDASCAIFPYANMVVHTRTTLNIDDTVMRCLRQEAARRDTTMSALVEAGLRLVLADPDAAGARPSTCPPALLKQWRTAGGHQQS